MSTIDDWFPYPHYRPHQETMLNAAAGTARNGGILMIDAPTGSGKSASSQHSLQKHMVRRS